METATPIVSICCITYNHERFINQALESFAAQVTDFDYEIVVSDDGSSDNTIQLVEAFSLRSKVPVRVVRNVNKKGVGGNFLNGFQHCNGRYIAVCEGDDYWVGTGKLQKQFECLQQNKEISVCGHLSYKLTGTETTPLNFPTKETVLSLTDYLKDPFFHTSSFFFVKKVFLDIVPEWYTDLYSVDNFTVLLLSARGKIGMVNEYFSVYRINAYSISNKYNIISISTSYLTYLGKFDEMTQHQFHNDIGKVALQWQLRSYYLLPHKERTRFIGKNVVNLFREFRIGVSIKLLFKYIVSYAFKIR